GLTSRKGCQAVGANAHHVVTQAATQTSAITPAHSSLRIGISLFSEARIIPGLLQRIFQCPKIALPMGGNFERPRHALALSDWSQSVVAVHFPNLAAHYR